MLYSITKQHKQSMQKLILFSYSPKPFLCDSMYLVSANLLILIQLRACEITTYINVFVLCSCKEKSF